MGSAAIAGTAGTHEHREADVHGPTYQAYQILHWGFVAAPVIAGAGALALARLSAVYDVGPFFKKAAS
jgi:hypothetical protein